MSPKKLCVRLCIGFIFLCTSLPLASQISSDKKIASLAKEALKYERKPDSLYAIGTKILALSKKNNHEKGLLDGYLIVAQSYYVRGDFETSIKYNDSLLHFEKSWVDKEYVKFYRAKRNKAIATIRSGNATGGLEEFYSLLEFTKKHKDAPGIAGTYSNIGISKKNEGNYDEAIDLYAKAMHIYDSLGAVVELPPLLMNIGIAQSLLGNNQKSLESFREAIHVAKKNNVERDEYRGYNNIATVFIELKQPDSALFYLKKIIPHYRKNNIKRAEYLAYQNLGAAFLLTKEIDSAYLYLSKANTGFKEINNPKGIAESYFKIAEYLHSDENYKKAIVYLDSSSAIAKDINNFVILKNTYTLRSKIYEKRRDFEKANTYLKIAQEIEAQMFQLESAKQLNEILTKYQVDKKDAQIADLDTQKSIYKSTAFLIGLISIVLLFVVILYWLRNKKSKKELTSLRDELENYNSTGHAEKAPALLHLKSKAVVNIKELLYIKSDGHYLEFFTQGNAKPEIDRNTLKEMTERLASEGFSQIHKSYLVNLDYIRIINSTKLMLDDGTWLPLSRTYKPKLKETLLHTTAT